MHGTHDATSHLKLLIVCTALVVRDRFLSKLAQSIEIDLHAITNPPGSSPRSFRQVPSEHATAYRNEP